MPEMNITIGGDLTINRLGYGAMRITGEGIWGMPRDRNNAISVLKRAVELGVTMIDTADAYGPNTSEELIAEALFPYQDVVIATKGGLTRPGPGNWVPDCSPSHLKAALEGSLSRLKLDRIDLYQLHTIDPKVSLAESVNTLKDLQQEGKIRHIGLSNVSVEQLAEAQKIVEIVSVQNHYNVANRNSEDVLQACEASKIAFLPYFPIGGGQMAGEDQLMSENGPLTKYATAHQATPGQIALAWLLHHSPVTVPIPGTSTLEHLEENIAAANISLSADEVTEIEELFPQ
jgi:pyridoxine 4-dehydrogenase